MNWIHYNLLMPKIIENLETRILQTAEELYRSYGFENVSIHQLAVRLNIADGTIYNYFPTKEAIFTRILSESWLKTKEALKQIAISRDSGKSIDHTMIQRVYYDTQQRQEVQSAALTSDWRVKTFRDALGSSNKGSPVSVMGFLFSLSLNIPEDQIDPRDGVGFLYLLRGCLANFPDENDQNLIYLYDAFAGMKQRYMRKKQN